MQTISKDPSTEENSNNKIPVTLCQIIQAQPKLQNEVLEDNFYRQQRYRWVIIALVGMSFAINNMANNAIIPIASKVSKVYDLSSTYTNVPIQISYLINPIMNFTVGHFIDKKGLGISFRIGCALYVVGLLGFCLINFGYHWVLIGAILIALGQPLVMNCPAKIATFWFISKNRTLATGIVSAINLVTLGVSLVLPAIFVPEDSQGDEAKDQIFSLYSKYFLVACVNCVFVMIFMRQRPERLPSAGAQQEKTTISKTVEIIRSDRNIWKFLIAAVLMYGTFLSFGSTSNMLFKPYGFADTQIAIFGVCLLVSGVLGSIAYTLYIKKTIKYKNAIYFACVFSLVFIIANTLLMNLATSQRILISVMIAGMGFNMVPMVPISYDLGCELTFPVGQAQIVGIISGGAMIYGVVLSLTLSSAIGFSSTNQAAIIMIIYTCLYFVGAVLYCLVDINLKRRDHQILKSHQKRGTIQYQNNETINDSAKDGTLIRPLRGKKRSESEQILSSQQQNGVQSIISQERGEENDSNKDQSGEEASPQKIRAPARISEPLIGKKAKISSLSKKNLLEEEKQEKQIQQIKL